MERQGDSADERIGNLTASEVLRQLREFVEHVHGAAYPLTAPSVRPLTKSFMEKVKRMMTGMEAMA